MEPLVHCLSYFLVLLVCIVSIQLMFHKMKKSSNNDDMKIPPGKWGWPVIGETLDFFSAGREGTPERFFVDRVKKYSSEVFKTSLLGEKTIVLCGAEGNKFLLSNKEHLVTIWWPRTVEKIFTSTSTQANSSKKELTMKTRRLVSTFLNPETLQSYVGIMDSMAKTHIESQWNNTRKNEVVAYPLAKHFSCVLACRLFLHIDDEERITKILEPLELLLTGIFSLPVNLRGSNYNRAIRAAGQLKREVSGIIRERRKEISLQKKNNNGDDRILLGRVDILSHMLMMTTMAADPYQNGGSGSMSESELADKVIVMLMGSLDTTSTVITFILKYLAELPDIYDRVLREQKEVANGKQPGELLNWKDLAKMKYSWNVACEVMRLVPPIQGNFRLAVADFEYAGFKIPQGWKLYWSAISTHKDPRYFPDPEKFDPSRFEGNGPSAFTYLPFGAGIYMCPGKEYGRIQILTFMHNICTRFRWQKIIPSDHPDDKTVMLPKPEPPKGLPLRLFSHN